MEGFRAETGLDDTARNMNALIAGALATSMADEGRSTFLADLALSLPRASRRRGMRISAGEPAPSFIAFDARRMPGMGWSGVFESAESTGASLVLPWRAAFPPSHELADAVATHRRLVFPWMVDGIQLDQGTLSLFELYRNLIPLHTVPGSRSTTDGLLGVGAYSSAVFSMDLLSERGVYHGIVVPLGRDNLDEATDPEFLDTFQQLGCRLVVYVPSGLPSLLGRVFDEDDRVSSGSVGIPLESVSGSRREACDPEDHVRRVLGMRLGELRSHRPSMTVLDCSLLHFGDHMEGFPGYGVEGFERVL